MSEAKTVDLPSNDRTAAKAGGATTDAVRNSDGETAPLLDALAYVTRWAGKPRSLASLTAGLPWRPADAEGKPDIDLVIRAAERAGFDARLSGKRPGQLTAAELPALIHTEKGVLVLLSWDEDTAEIKRIGTSGNDESRTRMGRSKLDSLKLKHPPLIVQPVMEWEAMGTASARPDVTKTMADHWFWGPVSQNRWIYAQVALASLMINLFGLATPLFIMNVYDRVLPNAALETGWALGLGALVVFGFDFLLRGLRGYFIDVAGRRADLKLAGRLFDQMLDIQLDRLQGRASGALANMLREFESVREFFTSATLAAMVDLPFVFLFLGVIYLIGGPIAFGLALCVFVIALVGLAIQWPLRRLIERAQVADDTRHGLMVETINGIETIRSTGADRRLRARYADLLATSTWFGQRSRLWAMQGLHTAMFMQQVASVFVILSGMYLVADGTLTVGGLIACVILGTRSIAPLGQVAQLATRFQQARHALIGLNGLMEEPVERPADRRFLHRDKLDGHIAFEDVTYHYPGAERPALNQISISIEAGQKVGVIGRVGSGKSTLARLIAGLSPPRSGLIRIDQTDIAQLDPADLRRNIALVPQDVFLMRGSLRDNIAASRPDATDEQILEAATIAGVHEFAARHPQGYDMPLGERGQGLSGGQRQAVAIARALLGQANTLILDEATNAMDQQGETALCKRLEPYLKDRTLVLITHRQSMLALVDHLIVVDHGQIAISGPKQEVLTALSSGKVKVPGQAEGGA
ncbi:MAG: type I secretion system permease/ATPase [Alphaproteobacteria bacterium]|nr:type I secretion system permease/ATPase [Alphaproteobacteria bacterium SS10]